MKVGILGSGDVGKALGRGFVTRGHEVMIGSREPEKLAAWVAEQGKTACSGTPAEAVRFGDVVVFAPRWSGAREQIDAAGGPGAFAGKVVVDVTNPLVFAQGGPPSLALGHTDSGGEQVQRWLPDAKVVKAWNTVGNAHMVDPKFPGGAPILFLCGNDKGAKSTVGEIARSFGWTDVADIGGIEGSRELEPMCILWVKYAMASGGWNHAFAMLRK